MSKLYVEPLFRNDIPTEQQQQVAIEEVLQVVTTDAPEIEKPPKTLFLVIKNAITLTLAQEEIFLKPTLERIEKTLETNDSSVVELIDLLEDLLDLYLL